MPIYEFQCQECDENFEKLVRITGASEVTCPRCGSIKTRKKLSAFAASSRDSGSSWAASSSSSCSTGGT